jgi:hypothetical protein
LEQNPNKSLNYNLNSPPVSPPFNTTLFKFQDCLTRKNKNRDTQSERNGAIYFAPDIPLTRSLETLFAENYNYTSVFMETQ